MKKSIKKPIKKSVKKQADIQFIKQKMIRLLVISSLIMIVGLLAVFFAIVYKVNDSIDNIDSLATSTNATIKLETGTNILETSIAGDNIILRVQDKQGQHKILIYKNEILQKTILITR